MFHNQNPYRHLLQHIACSVDVYFLSRVLTTYLQVFQNRVHRIKVVNRCMMAVKIVRTTPASVIMITERVDICEAFSTCTL